MPVISGWASQGCGYYRRRKRAANRSEKCGRRNRRERRCHFHHPRQFQQKSCQKGFLRIAIAQFPGEVLRHASPQYGIQNRAGSVEFVGPATTSIRFAGPGSSACSRLCPAATTAKGNMPDRSAALGTIAIRQLQGGECQPGSSATTELASSKSTVPSWNKRLSKRPERVSKGGSTGGCSGSSAERGAAVLQRIGRMFIELAYLDWTIHLGACRVHRHARRRL